MSLKILEGSLIFINVNDDDDDEASMSDNDDDDDDDGGGGGNTLVGFDSHRVNDGASC